VGELSGGSDNRFARSARTGIRSQRHPDLANAGPQEVIVSIVPHSQLLVHRCVAAVSPFPEWVGIVGAQRSATDV
jgi:hypothetical protein